MTKISDNNWINIRSDPIFGPISQLGWACKKCSKCFCHTTMATLNPKCIGCLETVDVLLDTGSIYLLAVEVPMKTKCNHCIDLPSDPQEYFYAGPSAKFEWHGASPILKSISNDKAIILSSCVPVGDVPQSSASALGLPAVMGLAPLTKEYSQRFGVASFVDQLRVKSFAFRLKDLSKPQFSFDPKIRDLGVLIGSIPISPQITQPTPGLGFLTTNIASLKVRFVKDGILIEYEMIKTIAAPSLPRDFQVEYVVRNNGIIVSSSIMSLIQWYVLFDSGTQPAVFYADASVNLLGSRIDNSILPGQSTASDFVSAQMVEFGFNGTAGLITIQASNVTVPTLTPDKFSTVCSIFTVFGYQMMLGRNLHFKIEKGLPESIDIYA